MDTYRRQLIAVLCGLFGLTALAATRYVNVNSATPTPPYTNWATAAKVIQVAVDAAAAGDEIVVTNGVYATGGRAVYATMTNRVAVTKPLTLRSVNGPAVTIIRGYQVPGTTNGSVAIRCAYLTNGAVLSGFTLTNGATQTFGDSSKQQSGGGIWCESTNAVLTNCVLAGNSASLRGGGAYYGTLNHCALAGNSASSGGGAYSAMLNDCTLTGNSASSGGGASSGTLNNCMLAVNSASSGGGGASSAALNHCTLMGNSAFEGGGAHSGTLNHCTLTGNVADDGGGASVATLNHCTLTGNSARLGGGSYSGTLNNCIVYYNTAAQGGNYYSDFYYSATLNYCCTTPLPPTGTGNISAEPLLASLSHLSASSPCRGAGSSAYTNGMNLDLDGEPWANPPSIGCDEFWSGSVTSAVSVAIVAAYTNVAAGFSVDFRAMIDGRVSASRWDFGDGVVVNNRPHTSHAWAAPGVYAVELRAFNETYPAGVAATVLMRVVALPEHYVALGSSNPVPPYISWATAATNIQDAVDAAVVTGALVWVSNGVYQARARAVNGMSNRVAVTKPLILHSVNGPEGTIIRGDQVPGTTNGPSAVRCVYLANGAVLSGFTLTNGATQASGDAYKQQSGGGVWCETTCALLTNCVLAGNSAYYGGGAHSGTLNNCTLTANSAAWSGGGIYSGALNNCTLTGNSASSGGGADSGTLNHCTLTGNSASAGGGADFGTLNHCTLTGNSASSGGGAYYGTLNNCTLTGNSASWFGGGAYSGTLNNCTLTGNSASWFGGGAYSGTLNNCIVYYNTAPNGRNFDSCTLEYCCTWPLPSTGTGNNSAEPLLASLSHLSANSPCRGAGSAVYASGLDLDGEPWASPPSIGCDEFWSGSATGAVSVALVAAYTNVAAGFSVDFRATIDGWVSASRWDFGDGVTVSNRPSVSHSWSVPGDYAVELRAFNETYPAGVTATVLVQVVSQPVHCVALESVSPLPPYSSWATAATNIQDAVDAAAVPGALIWVSNGVYQSGARAANGMSNRVAVTKPLTLRSVNGPGMTIIRGYQVPGTNNGAAAIRCAYLTNGTVLSGFTLTNGATQTSGDDYKQQSGGGVWCESVSAVVTNCVLIGNSAYYFGGSACYGTLNHCTLTGNLAAHGGGAYDGTLNHCTLATNSASYYGGGAYYGTLNHCTLAGNSAGDGGGAKDCTLNDCTLTANSAHRGGGADYGALNNCTLTSNSASYGGGVGYSTMHNCVLAGNSATNGGGAYNATLKNCAVIGNSANYGGGAYWGTLNNCALTGNSAYYDGGGACSCTLNNCTLAGNSASTYGGGAFSGTLNNCIAYYNTAPNGGNYTGCTVKYCCTTPLPDVGKGNITAAPSFVDTNGWGDLRLQPNSPCINAGHNDYVASTTDMDGSPRIAGSTVDIGAYECQSPALLGYYIWLEGYNLSTMASLAYVDTDSDGHNNWQEWRADTSPTNAMSRLALALPMNTPTGVTVTWRSVASRSYFVERGSDLTQVPVFHVLMTNVPGREGSTIITDTTATNGGPYLYRVGVQ